LTEGTTPAPGKGAAATLVWRALLALVLVLLAACPHERSGEPRGEQLAGPSPPSAPTGLPQPPAAAGNGPDQGERTAAPLVLFLGDSLTAGYGLAEGEAFPALLGELLEADGHPIRVLNAGVSGDTSAGGLRRLDWLLSQKPSIVVVELGANDGLRGLPLEHTEENLREILLRVRADGAQPLLVGMQVPPNYGPEYAPAFAEIFPRLAKSLDVPLVGFLLDGVGGRPELNLADGIHPTAEGHRILAENVLPRLRLLVEEVESAGRAVR